MRLLPKWHSFDDVMKEIEDGLRDGTVVPRLASPPLSTEQAIQACVELSAELRDRLNGLGMKDAIRILPAELHTRAEQVTPGSTADLLDHLVLLEELTNEYEEGLRVERRRRQRLRIRRTLATSTVLCGLVGAGVYLTFSLLAPERDAVAMGLTASIALGIGTLVGAVVNNTAGFDPSERLLSAVAAIKSAIASFGDNVAPPGPPSRLSHRWEH